MRHREDIQRCLSLVKSIQQALVICSSAMRCVGLALSNFLVLAFYFPIELYLSFTSLVQPLPIFFSFLPTPLSYLILILLSFFPLLPLLLLHHLLLSSFLLPSYNLFTYFCFIALLPHLSILSLILLLFLPSPPPIPQAHKLKNAEAGLTKALNALPAKKRILLSGTPMQNELREFFNMVRGVHPCLYLSVRLCLFSDWVGQRN